MLARRGRMKKSPKRLAIAGETLRRLDDINLAPIRGGAAWSNSECKTTYTLTCTYWPCATIKG